MISYLTGFVASVQHVVTGPDHMAAVTPLAIDSKKKSWLVGLGWGMGHTTGMLIIGSLFLLFKEILPVNAIAEYSDQLIGILLIIIGTWSVLRTRFRYRQMPKNKPRFHTHYYSSYTITHLHDDVNSNHGDMHRHVKPVKQNAFAALGIGVVHGASGFNHILALLPTLALPTMRESVLYVIVFALGTVTVMITFSFFMGLIAHRSEMHNQNNFLKWFTYCGGVAAVVIGIVWLLGWGM